MGETNSHGNDEQPSNLEIEIASLLFQHGSDLISLNAADGTFIYACPSFKDILGYDPEYIMGKSVFDFIHPDDYDKVRSELKRSERDKGVIRQQHRIRNANGDYVWLECIASPTEQSDELQYICISREISEQKEIEDELRRSEERLRLLLENSEDIICMHDTAGKYVYYSGPSEFGVSGDDLVGKSPLDLFEKHQAEQIIEQIKEVASTGKPMVRENSVGWRSQTLWFSDMIYPIRSEDGKTVAVGKICRNITEIKNAEEKLKSTNQRLSGLVNSIPDLIFVISREGEFLDYHVKDERTLIFQPQEFLGKNVADIGLPEDHVRMSLGMLKKAAESGEIETAEYELDTPMGRKTYETRFSAINDNEILVVERDITDRKVAVRELRESRKMYQALTEHLPDIIMRLDKDGRYLYVSPVVEKLIGRAADEFVGRTTEEMGLDGDTCMRVNRGLQSVLQTREIYEAEYRLPESEEPKYFNVRLIPEFASDGSVETVLCIARDVSELKRLQEFASRAMRLETAGKIAGQVAHDFNNLLGPLIAYPDLIRTEVSDDSPINEYLDDMKAAAEQIADINQQLLTLGRRGHYTVELLNLNDLVNQFLQRNMPLPPELKLEKHLDPNLHNIRGGGSQIIRAINNLFANACDAMDDKGILTVKTENAAIDEKPGAFGIIPAGEYVHLSISDTGSGIVDEVISHMYEPFFSTKTTTRKRGSGLGLSVVNSVVEDHQGYMDCDTEPGRGTTMHLYFPAIKEPISPRQEKKADGGKEGVLVVDDDGLQRTVARKLLERLGYNVSTVSSGEEALEILKKQSFDLLLLDMIMPDGIDGTETFERARQINPTQKALIISGFAESQLVTRALKLGAGGFLRKPLTLDELAVAVRQELDKVVQAPE